MKSEHAVRINTYPDTLHLQTSGLRSSYRSRRSPSTVASHPYRSCMLWLRAVLSYFLAVRASKTAVCEKYALTRPSKSQHPNGGRLEERSTAPYSSAYCSPMPVLLYTFLRIRTRKLIQFCGVSLTRSSCYSR